MTQDRGQTEYRIVLPDLMGSTEATIIRWLMSEGDPVTRGDPLVEVETDKATIDMEAPESGLLGSILVGDGSTIETGATIAVLLLESKDRVGDTGDSSTESVPAAPVRDTKLASEVTTPPAHVSRGEGIAATRPARKLAREQGVDLRQVVGSGPAGRIELSDVERCLALDDEMNGSGRSKPLSAAQRAAVKRLETAWRVPQFALSSHVNASNLVERKHSLGQGTVEPTYTDFFIRAAALGLERVPEANVRWGEESIVYLDSIDIGVAVAVGSELEELYVPVVRNANLLSIHEVSAERQRVVNAARAKSVRPSDMSGASLTISNLGMYSVDALFPVLNAPEALIIGFGRVGHEHPNDTIDPTLTIVVVADHRAMGGAVAAKFLDELVSVLEADPVNPTGDAPVA